MTTLSKTLSGYFKPVTVRVDTQRKARNESKKLAASRGFEIERLKEGGFNVWPPKDISKDEFEGDHFANDWDEVLQKAQWYATH